MHSMRQSSMVPVARSGQAMTIDPTYFKTFELYEARKGTDTRTARQHQAKHGQPRCSSIFQGGDQAPGNPEVNNSDIQSK
jgi:hypothetical protein